MKMRGILYDERKRQLRALLAVVLALAGIVIGLASCGTDDLTFPGRPGPTATSRPTATASPEDGDDDDEDALNAN
jgi:hypothetical protein